MHETPTPTGFTQLAAPSAPLEMLGTLDAGNVLTSAAILAPFITSWRAGDIRLTNLLSPVDTSECGLFALPAMNSAIMSAHRPAES